MKRIRSLLLSLGLILACILTASAANTFEIKNGDFYQNGKVIHIYSGECHYSRMPHEYWRHRLQMLKAMGLNTVCTYVFWNFHEAEPGKWDFTGDRDLAQFIRIAGEEGLMVILRPGPYVCAEWEFGGYPWWLQNVSGLKIREDNTPFFEYTQKYLKRLHEEVDTLQCTKGGPIIMVQVENEYGSFVRQRNDITMTQHKAYMAKVKQQFVDAGFDVPFFTADADYWFEGGMTPGALPCANGEGNVSTLKSKVNEFNNGQGPYMVAESYPGWLDHWREDFNYRSGYANQVKTFIDGGASFNIYMAFGGTSFGFWAGANYDSGKDIQPDLTSYDYDAPITEAGWSTSKYQAIRNVFQSYTTTPLPAVPAKIKLATIPSINLTSIADVLAYAQTQDSVKADQPLTFEQLNQGYGYVLYQRRFTKATSGKLQVKGLRDYAVVYIDGKRIDILDRSKNKYSTDISIPANSTLQLLVENLGRINWNSKISQNTKGIISPVQISGNNINGNWIMTKLPMDEQPDVSKWANLSKENTAVNRAALKDLPVVYNGTFNLKDTADVFLNMASFAKGIVFVNGHNLGRYWYIGPQQTLYLPGCWLKKGVNTIAIFDQINDAPQTRVPSTITPILNTRVATTRGEVIPATPTLSDSKTTVWYQMFAPNRENRYPTSTGKNAAIMGNTTATTASQWKFVDRGDGSFDIVNRADSSYISPVANYNASLMTTTTQPSTGWNFTAASDGSFTISSGKTEINQTPPSLGNKVYNWSSKGDGKDLSDPGCLYAFDKVEVVTSISSVRSIPQQPVVKIINGKAVVKGNAGNVVVRSLDGHVVTEVIPASTYLITIGGVTYKYFLK